MTTIRDVAHEAGVSIQTVSNVIHGKPSVRPETQARVLDAIERLQYHPNRVAQGLRKRTSHTIGFLLSDPNPRSLTDPMHAEVIAGICDYARIQKYSLLIDTPVVDGDVSAERFLQLFRGQQIDAAVITLSGMVGRHDHLLERLVAAGVPFALLEQEIAGEHVYAVRSANYEGAFAATEHLIAAGHRRIAFIDSLQMWPAVELRLCGYAAAMKEHGLGRNLVTSSSPDWTAQGGAAAMDRLLDSPPMPRPTAVLAGNDILAVGALSTIRRRGLRIPADVAIIGFDDFEFTRYVDPTLTTVRLPAYEMGRRAAELLINHLTGKPAAERQIVLPTELIVRQSA
jgi:DNA-binding LacI/PurR family transcriptional regulator